MQGAGTLIARARNHPPFGPTLVDSIQRAGPDFRTLDPDFGPGNVDSRKIVEIVLIYLKFDLLFHSGMVSVEPDQIDFRVIFSSYHNPWIAFENGKICHIP